MIDPIEKLFIQNELTRKRYRRFKQSKAAVIAMIVFFGMAFFSFSAEFWANSKPVVMWYQGQIYFPVIKEYHPSDFGRNDIFVMDYRTLSLGEKDFVLWPLIKWDPYESNSKVETYPSGPSESNLFGTDDRGRDVFTRLLYGFRYSITYSVGVWLVELLLGITFGAMMGYHGGKIDLFGQRFVEVFESMPYLLLLITIISIFSPNVFFLILFSALLGWVFISIYMRAEFLSLRKREFVEAARALGASHWRIVTKHILPNALTPIITFSPFLIAGGIVGLSTLDYLGLGLKAPTPSWGELFGQAQKYFTIAWWLAVYPALALFVTLVCLNTIGESIRDAFDAKKNLN